MVSENKAKEKLYLARNNFQGNDFKGVDTLMLQAQIVKKMAQRFSEQASGTIHSVHVARRNLQTDQYPLMGSLGVDRDPVRLIDYGLRDEFKHLTNFESDIRSIAHESSR